jgi:hypothetical protein
MTLLKVTGPGGVLIYEGEGDIVMSHDPSGPAGPGATHLTLRTEPDGGPNRDVAVPPDANPFWTVHYDLSGDRPLTRLWEVELSMPLARIIEMRRAFGLPYPYGDIARSLAVNGAMSEDEARASLDMVLRAPEPSGGCGGTGLVWYNDLVRDYAARDTMLPQVIPAPESYRDRIAEAYDLPRELLGDVAPVAEYDELISSTRAEFPHDPLEYGRVYPGDAGTSRWTPPEDPDEVIPSCPA